MFLLHLIKIGNELSLNYFYTLKEELTFIKNEMNIRLITDVKVDYNILNWLIDWLGTYLHTNTLPIFLTTLKEGQRIMTQRGVKESHLR